MEFRKLVIVNMLVVILVAMSCVSVFAQTDGNNYFGDKDQPGNRLHSNIMTLIDAGYELQPAISEAIDNSLSDSDNTLNGESKSAVAFDIPLANDFYTQMVNINSLIDVTIGLIQQHPDKTVHVITLGVVLYPDFVQEVFDGAALSGTMHPDDILIAALQAGADPSRVSAATAAGASVEPPVFALPLGAGIGAGGTGGGDTTASSN